MNDKNNDVPMIEEYRHESEMVHSTKKSKYTMIVAIACCIVAIVSIIGNIKTVDIFTTKYNSRTSEWLATIQALVDRITVTGVTDGYTEILQQLPPP